jgi:ribose transport system permease protein
MTSETAHPAVVRHSGAQGLWRVLRSALIGRQAALTLVTVALFTYFAVSAPYFLTSANLFDVARVSSFLLIVAIPMTYLLIARELDLSVGSLYGFCAVWMAIAATSIGLPLWVAAASTLLMGALIGAFNGVVSQVLGVPSIVATLGMFSLLRGLGSGVSGGVPIQYSEQAASSFVQVANGTVAGVPAQVLWGAALLVLGGFVLRFTRFGSHVYATGGNEKAAMANGISTRRVKITCFVLSGLSCGLVAALQGGWLLQGSPATGSGFELQVIAAVIIGGVAISGGAGTVYGTVLGVLIIGMLANGLVLMNVEANWNQFFVGLLIVVVATAEVAINRRGEVARLFRRARLSRRHEQPRGETQ